MQTQTRTVEHDVAEPQLDTGADQRRVGYQASLQDILNLLVLNPREFRARLTWVEMPNLNLLRAREPSASVKMLEPLAGIRLPSRSSSPSRGRGLPIATLEQSYIPAPENYDYGKIGNSRDRSALRGRSASRRRVTEGVSPKSLR